jgi:APA family basic amino acid/polyamine antiporter
MALTLGFYAYPDLARPTGIAAVVVLTAVNYRGVQKTAALTRVLIGLVLFVLAVVLVAALSGGTISPDRLDATTPRGPLGILQSAGLLFFAFAGYARIATLGEEVVQPEVTIPRAIPIALGAVVLVYAAVLGAALLAIGPDRIARSANPLAAAVEVGRWSQITPLVRAGAAVASAGVLLSLLAGVSRNAISMARRGDLPRFLGAVHQTNRTPHHAEMVAGALVTAIGAAADLRGAIGFSSFAVLTYYALTNAASWTLPRDQRRWPRWLTVTGLLGCIVLALTLPPRGCDRRNFASSRGVSRLAGASLEVMVLSIPGGEPFRFSAADRNRIEIR